MLYRKVVANRLNAQGPMDRATIDAVARGLATAFPSA